jgi:ribosomal protein S18 acetylase RimI-like enzyme
MNIQIEQAGPDAARLISVIGTVSFYEAYFEQDTPADIANYITESFGTELIERELADPSVSYHIAYLNEKAVGYAKLVRDSMAEGADDGRGIEVKRIYTLERVWGKGVGDRLLAHCKKVAKESGAEYIWLGVWEENARALRFYAKHGFRRVGTVTFPYGDSVGINKVMKLEL